MRILAHSSHLRLNVLNHRQKCRDKEKFACPRAGARTGWWCDVLEVFDQNKGFRGLRQRICENTDVAVVAAQIRCVGG